MKNLVAYLILILAFHSAGAQAIQTKNNINNIIERPKLVVGLVVDQMRWDYLYRYLNRYGKGGFRKLLKKGYSYDNTFIPFTPAVTSSGHSCLYTGVYLLFMVLLAMTGLKKPQVNICIVPRTIVFKQLEAFHCRVR